MGAAPKLDPVAVELEFPVPALRARVAAFALPWPQDLGGRRAAAAGMPPEVRRALAALAEEALAWLDRPEQLSLLAGEALAWVHPPRPTLAQLSLRDGHQDTQPHDAYFRLARCEDEGGQAALHAVLQALRLYCGEVRAGAPQDAQVYRCIAEALIELWHAAVQAPAWPAAAHATLTPVGRSHERSRAPVRRWLLGHQIFAVLTQGLIATLNDLQRAAEAADAQALHDTQWQMARLYQASAAAFRFTGDLRPEDYDGLIRPSMCEPQAPPGFSGALSVDHAALVRQLARCTPALQAAADVAPEGAAAMASALAAVYDDHVRVCEHFDGVHQPSLRTAAVDGDTTAVAMLGRFKTRRLQMLPATAALAAPRGCPFHEATTARREGARPGVSAGPEPHPPTAGPG